VESEDDLEKSATEISKNLGILTEVDHLSQVL
jgi:hypothetical protein